MSKFNVNDVVCHVDNATYKYRIIDEGEAGWYEVAHLSLPSMPSFYMPEHLLAEIGPPRYVVEIRRPKAGERYIYSDVIVTAVSDHHQGDGLRPVIVEEL